jgi:hypothetical protein
MARQGAIGSAQNRKCSCPPAIASNLFYKKSNGKIFLLQKLMLPPITRVITACHFTKSQACVREEKFAYRSDLKRHRHHIFCAPQRVCSQRERYLRVEQMKLVKVW